MAEFLKVRLDDGTEVLFQNADEDLVSERGGGDEVRAEAGLVRLESMARAAAAVCDSLRSRVQSDEVSVELGAGLSGEVGWFFAKSSMEASIKITLKWTSNQADAAGAREG